MSAPDDFSFSERNKRAKSQVDAPPPGAAPEPPPYAAPPPQDFPPPPPRDYTPPSAFAEPAPTPRRKSSDGEEDDFELPIDPWRLVVALKAHWPWMVWAGLGFLVLGSAAGFLLAANKISITLIQLDVTAPFEAGVGGEVFKPHAFSRETLVSLMQSPKLKQRVSEKARPYISPRALQKALTVQPERNTELVHLVFTGKDKQDLVELANLYANEAVNLTREEQLEDLSRTLKSYQEKESDTGVAMQKAEQDMQAFRELYKSFNPEAEATAYDRRLQELVARVENHRLEIELLDMQLTNSLASLAWQSPIAQKLETTREELRALRARYTDAFPAVQNKLREVQELEQQLAGGDTNNAPGPVTVSSSREVEMRTRRVTLEREVAELEQQKEDLRTKALAISESGGRYILIKSRQDSLRKKMEILAARRSETEYYHDNANGYYRVFAPATSKDIDDKGRWLKLLMIALGGLVVGVVGAAAVIVIREVADDRLKTASDLKRVTGLPVLAMLGDLNKMSPSEKETWAFRTWTALSGQLSRSANHGMVCGLISSTSGEGRSTWINLLVEAAGQRGLRVLTISTRPSPQDLQEMEKAAEESEKEFSEAVAEAVTETAPQLPATAVMMTARALAFPADVSQKFIGPNAVPSAHIALPGWVWNLERRKQFQRALAHWRSLESMVLLVELPPASVPEAVLLAENLPQLIWLADSGKPRARATREQLETLRHAKCRLVGAVLNHEPKPVLEL